ncbi:MAG: hypothetical protein IJ514_05400 [Clostridia bacterium]|nr:hypothetical protein [Clostridia bacterium]
MKKKALLSIVALLACGSAAAGVASLAPKTASAASASFYSEGASVKITSSVAEAQVRFNTTMTDEFYGGYFTNGVANEGVETGMLVVPYDVYQASGVSELTLETAETCHATPVETTTLWADAQTSGLKEAYAVLPTNAIPEESHNRVLLFVGYVTDGTTPVYTAPRKTSMSHVAWKAQSAAEDVVSSTNKAALKEAYMHDYEVTFNDAYARTMTLEYGTYINAQTSKTVYWDEECTEAVADTDYVSCAAQVYVKDEEKDTSELLSFDYACDTERATDKAVWISNNYSPETAYVEEFAGETGVMQVTHHSVDRTTSYDTWSPQFTLQNPKQSMVATSTVYDNYEYLVVRMYIVKTDEYQVDWDYVAIEDRNASGCKVTLDAANDYNKWIDVKFALTSIKDVIGEKTTLKIYGEDAGAAAKTGDGAYTNQVGMYYVAGIWLENAQTQYTFTEDNYADYVASYVTGSATASISWSDTAEAVQIDYTITGTGAIYPGFKLLNDNVDYGAISNNYDYFTVEVYYVATGTDPYDENATISHTLDQYIASNGTGGKLCLGTTDGKVTSGNGSSAGQWIKIIAPIECLAGDSGYYGRMNATQKTTGTARMYVKGFELCKAELAVEATGTNGLVSAEALTVSVTDGEGATVTTYTGFAARTTGGNSTTIKNGAFTVNSGREGDWYVVVVDGNGKVGLTKITVAAAATA